MTDTNPQFNQFYKQTSSAQHRQSLFHNYKYTLKDFNSITNDIFPKYSIFRLIFNNIENGENNIISGYKIFDNKGTYELLSFGATGCEREQISLHVKGISHMWSEFFNKLDIETNGVIPYFKLKNDIFPLLKEVIFELGKYEDMTNDKLSLVNTIQEGISFPKIISHLYSEGKVKVRYTNHKFRCDCRDIEWIEALNISNTIFPISVDSLGGLNKDLKEVEDYLCRLVGINDWLSNTENVSKRKVALWG